MHISIVKSKRLLDTAVGSPAMVEADSTYPMFTPDALRPMSHGFADSMENNVLVSSAVFPLTKCKNF